MEIYRSGNGGRSTIASGSLKRVNALNVSPQAALVATAAGLTFNIYDLDNYEMFDVAQTSAGTDFIILPDTLPRGAVIWLQAASAISIACPTGSSVTLNNVAAPAKGTIAANATALIIKVSPTRIIYTQYTSAGVASAPVPS
jgi:hypothetical protein